MKIANLLEQHRKFSGPPGALSDCLGDGFLLAHNSFYKRVRAAVALAGFQFSTKQNDAYRALPLSQLDAILKAKVIPYIDNVSVLDEVEAKMPKVTVWNDVSDNLKGNSIFHEACHGAARDFVSDLAAAMARETQVDLTLARTLAMILEESFANTLELLSIIDADDQIHRIFLELNSYAYMLDDRVHLAHAAKDLGLGALTKFMLLMYVHSNFLRDLKDKDFERSLTLATDSPQLDGKQKKSLRQLAKIAFKLNPRFREVTTRFYLRLNGIRPEAAGPESFDFLTVLEGSPSARVFLSAASDF